MAHIYDESAMTQRPVYFVKERRRSMSSESMTITKEIIEKQGLSMDEYEMIKKRLGRVPNYTELGMFSAMWSEHC